MRGVLLIIVALLLPLVVFGGYFDITVQAMFLGISAQDVGGAPYYEWNLDTLAMDTTVAMSDSDGVQIVNNSNVDVKLLLSVSDEADGWGHSDYAHWTAGAYQALNRYVLEGSFENTIDYDPVATLWLLITETSTVLYSPLAVDDDTYLHFRFRTPVPSSDYYGHRLTVIIIAQPN